MRGMRQCAVAVVTAFISFVMVVVPAQGSKVVSVEPIGQLRFAVSDPDSVHAVRGIVSKVGVPLFVQDRTGGVEVTLGVSVPVLHIGDEVVVSGKLAQTRYSSRLGGAQLKVLSAGTPDPPVSITAAMAASGNYDRVFVETEGMLERIENRNGAMWLLLADGKESFTVEAPVRPITALPGKLVPQSRVRVRGICAMDDRRSGEAVPFTIIPRSAEDIDVVAPPPFWNRLHVIEVIGLALAIGLGSMTVYLYMERWRFSLVLDERTRMAHDLHDTLAQSFTGIAFQLQAVRNALRSGSTNLEKQVELTIGMVADCQEDARRSIAMLKPANLDTGSVLDNLRQQGEALTRGGKISFSVDAQGIPDRISRNLENVILRIGHEAITNAIRHANPTQISISLVTADDSVTLEVRDDGHGFSAATNRSRGFGIGAMHSRAHSHGGTFEIVSSPGAGTLVRAKMPLDRNRSRFARLFSIWREEDNRL